jgi:hypothetical protein
MSGVVKVDPWRSRLVLATETVVAPSHVKDLLERLNKANAAYATAVHDVFCDANGALDVNRSIAAFDQILAVGVTSSHALLLPYAFKQ